MIQKELLTIFILLSASVGKTSLILSLVSEQFIEVNMLFFF